MVVQNTKANNSGRLVRFCLIGVVLFAQNVFAHMEIYEPFDNINFGLWAGVGDVQMQSDACIVATSNGLLNGAERDYQLRAAMNNLASQFTLSNGANQLPFSLSITDLHSSGTQTLAPNSYSSNLTYNRFCFSNGNNARLTMSIPQASLYAVPAGIYTASLNLAVRRIGNGNGSTNDTQNGFTGRIQIPTLIQLTNLDDINLGTYDGVSSVVSANESFCIYTNSSNYTVRPSSSTVGASPTTFAVANGANRVEYSLRFNNAADGSSGAVLDNNQISGALSANQPSPLSVNCNGADNAAVYLQFQGPDLQAAPSGSYSGTLNLLVAPI